MEVAEVLNNAIVKIERSVNDAEAASVGFTVVEPIVISRMLDFFSLFRFFGKIANLNMGLRRKITHICLDSKTSKRVHRFHVT